MPSTVDFTAAIISKKLSESAKPKKVVKEAEELDKNLQDTVEEPLPPLHTDTKPLKDDSVDIENGENFEESVTDDVYFCAKCNKHFIATDDTPEEEIKCPACEEINLLIRVGSAQESLDNEENKDVKQEMGGDTDEEAEEIPDPEVDISDEDIDDETFESKKLKSSSTKKLESSVKPTAKLKDSKKVNKSAKMFDNVPLEEGLGVINKKYMNNKDKIRFSEGIINKSGNLILKGSYEGNKRPVFVTVEGFKLKMNSPKFILEGRTNILKNSKFKFLFVKEGTCYKIKKFGFGFIKESDNKTQKITGIIVDEDKSKKAYK